MTLQEVIAFCESLGEVEPRRPYGPQPLVMFYQGRKAFCNIMEDTLPLHIVMKCDPMEAEILRAACPSIRPGYHVNKRHWNSVFLDGTLPDEEIKRMLRNAYLLVSGRKKEVVGIQPTSL